MECHVFYVRDSMLREFFEHVNKGDSMDGWNVELIGKMRDGNVWIILSRRLSYPYALNELRKLEVKP